MPLDSSLLGGLRCFEVAARLLSFTKAANELSLTQGAVSQHIRHLEDRLGYALFTRKHRSLALTQKGVTLFECTRNAFLSIETTLSHLGQSDAPLQINCSPSFALQWLMPRLVEFHRLHADIPVRLKAEFQTLDRHSMLADDIDVAIRFDPGQYEAMRAVPILDEYLLPVATPEYLAQHPEFAAGRSLKGVDLLHDFSPWDGAPEFIEWRTWLESARPEWLGAVAGPQFNLASLAISAALSHQGVAVARTALVYEELEHGRLINIFGHLVPAPACYMLLTRREEDERVAAFSNWLMDECHRFSDARAKLLL
jgi:LysR family transcriptional regulator, glycine cleavage system transcriptional activator